MVMALSSSFLWTYRHHTQCPQKSADDNNCLFNSISLVLWGHAKKTVFLCLAAAIYGIVNHEKMVDQVMEGIMDWNDAVAWVSRSTTANISDNATMMQQP